MAITTHEVTSDARGGFVVPDLIRLEPQDEGLEFRCLKDGCNFHRLFGTLTGARTYITEHMQLNHRLRLSWPEAK